MKFLFLLFSVLTLATACGVEEQSELDSRGVSREDFWIDGANGFLGPDPVLSGNVLGFDLYVCSALTSVGYQAGHLALGQTQCYVAWGKGHLGFSNYRILQSRSKFRWIPRNQAGNSSFVQVGTQGGSPTGICRRKANDSIAPFHNGKMIGRPETGICYASWTNSSAAFGDFEVLVIR